jgi:hypothetical protein
VRLEHTLVLNRYFHGLFDARDLTELKQPLNVQEGRAGDGQSYFYGVLLGRVQDAALRDKLAVYDARVMSYLSACHRLTRFRPPASPCNTPVVHPKMILAAAVFFARREMSWFRTTGRPFAYFASLAVPSESARGLAHSTTLRAIGMSPANACVLDCGGPPPLCP